MTFAELFGCAMIAFGPSLAIFCLVVAKDPIRIIILISASFFWLVSLLLSSILWAIVVPLKEYLLFAVTMSILFQETFRYLFYKVLRKAELGLQRVSEVGEDRSQIKSSVHSNRIQLSLVSGLGFGLMSGAFSIVNILADSAGPGTVGINGDSPFYFLCSAFTTSAFVFFHICWSVILYYSCDNRKHGWSLFVIISHLAASYMTFLNTKQLYGISVPLEYALLLGTSIIALNCAGFRYDQLKSIKLT